MRPSTDSRPRLRILSSTPSDAAPVPGAALGSQPAVSDQPPPARKAITDESDPSGSVGWVPDLAQWWPPGPPDPAPARHRRGNDKPAGADDLDLHLDDDDDDDDNDNDDDDDGEIGGRPARREPVTRGVPVAWSGLPTTGDEGNPAEAAPPAQRPPRPARWARMRRRWLPEPLRDSRIDPGRRGVLVLLLVAALAAVIAAVGVWRNRPEPHPVSAVGLVAASGATASTSGAAPPGVRMFVPGTGTVPRTAKGVAGATGQSTGGRAAHPGTAVPSDGPGGGGGAGTVAAEPVVVSVTGWVARPGLVRLSAGARVADALAAAGGSRAGAELTGLNLAERLRDGQSVVVAGPTPTGAAVTASGAAPVRSGVTGGSADSTPAGPAGGSAESGAAAAPVDLNTADVSTLDALPGVGPVTAAGIVAWRTEHGAFTSVDQLHEIPGIGPAKFAQLAPRVTV